MVQTREHRDGKCQLQNGTARRQNQQINTFPPKRKRSVFGSSRGRAPARGGDRGREPPSPAVPCFANTAGGDGLLKAPRCRQGTKTKSGKTAVGPFPRPCRGPRPTDRLIAWLVPSLSFPVLAVSSIPGRVSPLGPSERGTAAGLATLLSTHVSPANLLSE